MTQTPNTRHSLIARLKDPHDQLAWEEFVQIYRPVVYRVAIAKGLQSTDAEDVTQKVLLSVSQAVENWKPNPDRALFRTWLNRIACNAAINSLTRGKPDKGSGDTGQLRLLKQQPVQSDPDSRLIQLEYRRECFRVAAQQIKGEFEPETWLAFWLTAVDGLTADDAAKRLNKRTGSVYTARSRVMKRLQQRVLEMTAF